MEGAVERSDEPAPEITVVVAPRDSYRTAVETLDQLLMHDGPPVSVIWVDDDRCPARTTRRIQQRLLHAGHQHIRLAGRRGANECRARGIAEATTPYVMLMDNDACLGPGALSTLLDCIRVTGAPFVAPLYLNADGSVHHAGGVTRIDVDDDGVRHLYEKTNASRRAVAALGELVRMPCTAVEMHGVLVDARALADAGGLDARLRSSMDCADLSLRLASCPGIGWLEPAATLQYANARPRLGDLAFYWARWSRATVEHDMRCFAETWGLAIDDRRLQEHRGFLHHRRMRPLRYVRQALRRLPGTVLMRAFDAMVDPGIDRFSDARSR